jgi:hypothetical protein
MSTLKWNIMRYTDQNSWFPQLTKTADLCSESEHSIRSVERNSWFGVSWLDHPIRGDDCNSWSTLAATADQTIRPEQLIRSADRQIRSADRLIRSADRGWLQISWPADQISWPADQISWPADQISWPADQISWPRLIRAADQTSWSDYTVGSKQQNSSAEQGISTYKICQIISTQIYI